MCNGRGDGIDQAPPSPNNFNYSEPSSTKRILRALTKIPYTRNKYLVSTCSADHTSILDLLHEMAGFYEKQRRVQRVLSKIPYTVTQILASTFKHMLY